MNAKGHKERLSTAQEELNQKAPHVAGQPSRQGYHLMAPAGWINDPNGCIYLNGRYHVFYQHNPYGPRWAAMHWGHASSEDLLHWVHHPIALAPSEPYDDDPSGGVFSGTAVSHEGTLYAFYTGSITKNGNTLQSQCLASSMDGGETFTKYEGNPVIAHPPDGFSSDFRDPKVLEYNGTWYMVVGASQGGGAAHNGDGCVLLYRSDDLVAWSYVGILAQSHGSMGTMWECPDLFMVSDKWVLVFSPMYHPKHQQTVYLVGDMDFERGVFQQITQGTIDLGRDYYAPQSLRDPSGRTLLIAWQNGWPWMPWFRGHGSTEQEGWCGSMTLPRSVELGSDNLLSFHPPGETDALRFGHWFKTSILVGQNAVQVCSADPVRFEINMSIDLPGTTARRLHFYMRACQDSYCKLVVDFDSKTMSFQVYDENSMSFNIDCVAAFEEMQTLTLRIFSDNSSIEIFTGDGRGNMSNAVDLPIQDKPFYFVAEGGQAHIVTLDSWGLCCGGNTFRSVDPSCDAVLSGEKHE